MYLIKRLIFSFFILLLASCNVTFKGQVKNDPFLEKLPTMDVNFGSICKAGLKDYVVEDFNKNVLEKGDKSNGKIIIYLCKFPFEELCLSVLILNRNNGILKTYKKTEVDSFWVRNRSVKSEDRFFISALESIKSDIKKDLPQLKKDLLASK